MSCIDCGKDLDATYKDFCKRCYKRKWYWKDPEKRRKATQDYQKRINYANEKTPESRAERNIKRRTRYHFPLVNQRCYDCNDIATMHHHTTKPIEFDKFVYICKKCHNIIHKGGTS